MSVGSSLLTVTSSAEFDALRRAWQTLPTVPIITTRAGRPVLDSPGGPLYVLLRGEETAGQVGFYEHVMRVGAAIGPHHQSTEDEAFYILEGDWQFRVGEIERVVGPGTLVFAPIGTTHAFKAVGCVDGRMLSWNAPAGHERFYVGMGEAKSRGLNPRLDAAPLYHTSFGDPPPREDRAQAKFSHWDDAPRDGEGDVGSAALLTADDSAGRACAWEIRAAPDAAPVRWPAASVQRFLYTLAGRWQARVGELHGVFEAGTTLFVPAGAECEYRAVGTDPARLFAFTAGAQVDVCIWSG